MEATSAKMISRDVGAFTLPVYTRNGYSRRLRAPVTCGSPRQTRSGQPGGSGGRRAPGEPCRLRAQETGTASPASVARMVVAYDACNQLFRMVVCSEGRSLPRLTELPNGKELRAYSQCSGSRIVHLTPLVVVRLPFERKERSVIQGGPYTTNPRVR